MPLPFPFPEHVGVFDGATDIDGAIDGLFETVLLGLTDGFTDNEGENEMDGMLDGASEEVHVASNGPLEPASFCDGRNSKHE